jgi:hypothetical protein
MYCYIYANVVAVFADLLKNINVPQIHLLFQTFEATFSISSQTDSFLNQINFAS